MELREGCSVTAGRSFCGLGRLLFSRFALDRSEWHSDRDPSALDFSAREANSFAVEHQPADSCWGIRRRVPRRRPAQRAWPASLFSRPGLANRRLEDILSRHHSVEMAVGGDCVGGCRMRVMPFREDTGAGLSDYGFVPDPLFRIGDLRTLQYW